MALVKNPIGLKLVFICSKGNSLLFLCFAIMVSYPPESSFMPVLGVKLRSYKLH